jgi:hypothetical protein
VINVNVKGKQGQQIAAALERLPDVCPICHHAMTPIDAGYGYMIGTTQLEHTFRCPSDKCQRTFVARYERTKMAGQGHFELHECLPAELVDFKCSEIIKAISADYCEIYNQAQKAEHYGLNLVVGPGYRKALEFLVKDYLLIIHKDPKDQEKIKKMQLGNCIAEYVQNDKVIKTAARAAWLGNDETHYVRKWEDKDVKDLKTLIALTVHWIEMEQMTDDAVKGMPEGKK